MHCPATLIPLRDNAEIHCDRLLMSSVAQVPSPKSLCDKLEWGFPFRTPFGLILAPSRQPGSHEVASPVIGAREGG